MGQALQRKAEMKTLNELAFIAILFAVAGLFGAIAYRISQTGFQ